jgi:hypothetical protein
VTFNADGNLIVTGFAGTSAAVVMLDINSLAWSVVSQGASFLTAALTGVRVGPDGTIYVSEFGNRRGGGQQVVAVDPTESSRTIVSDFGKGDSGLTQITDLAVLGGGSLLVVTGGTVTAVDPSTGAQTILMVRNARYSGIDVAPDDTFYVSGCEPIDLPCNGLGFVVQQPPVGGAILSMNGLLASPRAIAVSGDTAFVLNVDALFGSSIVAISLRDGSQRLIWSDD